jgi:hypothetical protein
VGSINKAVSDGGNKVGELSAFLIPGKLMFTGMAYWPGLRTGAGLGAGTGLGTGRGDVETHRFNVLFTLYPFLQRVPCTCGYQLTTGDGTATGFGALSTGAGILVETQSFFFLFTL